MDLFSYLCPHQLRYHYSLLPPAQQVIYDRLLEGILQHRDKIQVALTSQEAIHAVHHALRSDLPELFFLRSLGVLVSPLHHCTKIRPIYRFDAAESRQLLQAMEQRTGPLLKRMEGMSDRGKVRAIHDYLVQTVTYARAEQPGAHDIPGALLCGVSVCEGIAKAFQYLAARAGLESILVEGCTKEEQDSLHGWNVVYVDGIPYQLDVTFDLNLTTRNIRYDYFLLSDDQMAVDHQPIVPLPPCSTPTEFYPAVHSWDQLRQLVRQQLQPDSPLTFRLCAAPPADEDAFTDRVMEKVRQFCPLVQKLTHNFRMEYNVSRMIFRIILT